MGQVISEMKTGGISLAESHTSKETLSTLADQVACCLLLTLYCCRGGLSA